MMANKPSGNNSQEPQGIPFPYTGMSVDEVASLRRQSDASFVSKRKKEQEQAQQEAEVKKVEEAKRAEENKFSNRVVKATKELATDAVKGGLSYLKELVPSDSVITPESIAQSEANPQTNQSSEALANVLPSVAKQRQEEAASQVASKGIYGVPVRDDYVKGKANDLASLPADLQAAAVAQEGIAGRVNKQAISEGRDVIAPAVKQNIEQAAESDAERQQMYGVATNEAKAAEDKQFNDKLTSSTNPYNGAQNDHEIVAGVGSGLAGMGSGVLDAVPLVADAINQVINPYIKLAGGEGFGNAPRVKGAAELEKMSQDMRPDIANKKWDDLKGKGEVTDWLATQTAIVAPQMAGAGVASLVSKVRGLYLGAMGAMSAGGSYQQNKENGVETSAAIADSFVNGGVEILSEMLPFHVFDKLKDYLPKLNKAEQTSLIGNILNKSGIAATALAADSATEAGEEVFANTVQNASSKYIAGNKNIDSIFDGNKDAAIIGAIAGTPIGAINTGLAVKSGIDDYKDTKAANQAQQNALNAWNTNGLTASTRTARPPVDLTTLSDESLNRLHQTATVALPAQLPAIQEELARRSNLGTLEAGLEQSIRAEHPINQESNEPKGVLATAAETVAQFDDPVMNEAVANEAIDGSSLLDDIQGEVNGSQQNDPTQLATATNGNGDNQLQGSVVDVPNQPRGVDLQLGQNADTAATSTGGGQSLVDGSGNGQGSTLGGTNETAVIQNRNRSNQSSIAQMQSISARPDYGRLGFSRDFANGSPVVSSDNIPKEHLGKSDYTVASDGRRIPVQYAVVEASDLLASNNADGTKNNNYDNEGTNAVKAIAGNGRVAGLQSAYSKGNAEDYKKELLDDNLHGVDGNAIKGMTNPVLVRVMPKEFITNDIGDVSNTSGNLQLSAVEQAKNDINRVNLDALAFNEDGGITPQSVKQFVQAMPQAEQGELIDENGQPTIQAVDRINAAIFAKAYNSDELIRLYAQAQDPEARLVLSALAQLAGKMARLEGAGALDIRGIVTDAAKIIVNAKRNGISIANAASQVDLNADPDVSVIIDLFAKNTRSNKEAIEVLGKAADFAYQEATKPDVDMFGKVEKGTRADVINLLRGQDETRSTQDLENTAGRGAIESDATGRGNDSREQANAGSAEEGRAEQTQERENVTTQPNPRLRELVEAVTKRRAAASQLNKIKAFDVALQHAKDLLSGKQVPPIKFTTAARVFSNDPPLAEAFKELATLSKAPAKEAKANVANAIESYKQKLSDAKTLDELKQIGRDIQNDSALNDAQIEALDDLFMDAQDRFDDEGDTPNEAESKGNGGKSDIEELKSLREKLSSDLQAQGFVTDARLEERLKQVNAEISKLEGVTESKTDALKVPQDITDKLQEKASLPSTSTISTQERIDLRNKIEKELYGDGAKVKGKRLDIVIGLPASGKSTAVAEPLARENGSLIIDSDMAKERLPEYDNGAGAGVVHDESSDIAEELIATAFINGDNIVYPTVGKTYEKLESIIRIAKASGYTVDVHFVDIPVEKAFNRAITRYRASGRLVNPQNILNAGLTPSTNFDKLQENNLGDNYVKYSNDVAKGQDPEILSDTRGRSNGQYLNEESNSIGKKNGSTQSEASSGNQSKELELTGETNAEIQAKEKAAEEKRKQEAEANKKAEADAGVNDFALTGSNREADIAAASGAQDLFSQDEKQKAKDDLNSALSDLGDIFGKGFRASILPEQEQKLIPVLTRLFDAAFRLGYQDFKQAAKFVLDTIRKNIGNEVADAVTIDHLQGSYIGMAGKYGDKASKKIDVINVESKDEIERVTINANSTQAEELPKRSNDGNQQVGANGSISGEQVDAGVASTNEGANRGGRVSGGVSESTGTGAGSGSELNGNTPNTNGKNSDGGAVNDAASGELDYTIEDGDNIGKGSALQKYNDNIAAIKIIKAIESEGRKSTFEERQKLAKYVGWGGLKGVFDPNNKQFNKQYNELKSLLTKEEFESARASILNSHFTSPVIVKGIYDAVEKLGFRNGRVLEPSMGSGNFFGMMPLQMRDKSNLHGVELDNLTSRLASALYPNAVIATSTGFQDYQVPQGYFDMAIGNPPFGSETIVDKDRSKYSGLSIHNYFIAKMLDKVREGGIVPVVVSHSFLDAMTPKARELIASQANLVAGVRLPYTAFKENAGTDVITDILFFQKTSTPEKNPDWLHVADGDYTYNLYFAGNPKNVLGKVVDATNQYGKTYTIEPTGDLQAQLKDFIERLPKNIYTPIERSISELDSADNTMPEGVKAGSYFVNDKGEIRQRNNDVAGMKTSSPWTAKNASEERRMKGMVELRDLLRNQLRIERMEEASEKEIEQGRKKLNEKYDAFVKANGFVNSQINRRLFIDDTESALVQALEFNYDAGVTKARAASSNLEEKAPSADKADIMKRRVLFPPSEVLNVNNAKDALLASMNVKGEMDLDYMLSVYDKSRDEVVSELGDLAYEDPTDGFVDAERYLSGDVKTKLKDAQAAAEGDKRFTRNVEALKKVIPVDKMPSEIYASIGAGWIEPQVYQDFAKEITGSDNIKVGYLAVTAQWFTENGGRTDIGKMESEYGTDKMSSFEIFSQMMNGKPVEVKKRVADSSLASGYRLVTDEEATEAARQRMDKIKSLWDKWVWDSAERADKLASVYNDKFNRTVEREFDGSHLTLAGSVIPLRSHQKDAVWRALQERNVLLDHAVGAGKTFVMAAIAMEMKRLGIARKPFFAVPNHLTMQWRTEFAMLYPAANVLAATPEDFNKDNRERMFSKIATGDYDAIIVGHSSLTKIGLDIEIEKRMYDEQINEIAEAIEAAKAERGDRGIVRDMEKIKVNLESKIQDLINKAGKRDNVVTFNELGIDMLAVDEMHEFKNLFFTTQKQRVSGLGNPKGSGKAFDLFMKVRWMQETLGEKAPFITATGTPVSNSLSEMFTMQRYMRFDELKRNNLNMFDAWSRMYGEDEYVYEVAPSGVGYRISQRFSKFKNLPSLMGHYKSFADVITLQDLKDQAIEGGGVFPVPKIKGGRQTNVVAQRSDLQRDFFGVPVIRKDEQGDFVFQINNPEEATITQDGDGKWVLKASEMTANFETKEEAELELAEKSMSPVLDLDPESLVGKFNNLKQLTRETKGKVNALSLTGLANKAGLDYRLIDPSAPDFEGSKINQAVTNMVSIYKETAKDKGAQIVFCDLSIPLSARTQAANKDKRLYVLDDNRQSLTHKNGTLHTVENREGFPFYLVKFGKGDNSYVMVYEPVSGVPVVKTFADKKSAQEGVAVYLESEANRESWFDTRSRYEPITMERIAEYRDEKELEVAEDGSNEISTDDLESISGSSKFSVYDDIKAKLVKAGVKENEIAFIHDYNTPKQKQDLFKRVKSGDVRFLFGSTPKLGAGTNVQERLVGLHHIDAPWRPSDLEQREGRIIRQGNKLYERDPENFEVFIGRYATEQTYDTRRWQLLEHKAAGIEQLRKYSGEAEIDDVTSEAANAADMKAAASGNPLILEETKLRTEVKRLTALQKAHADGKYSMQRKLQANKNAVDKFIPEKIAEIEALISIGKSNPLPQDKDAIASFSGDGKTAKTREQAENIIADISAKVRISPLGYSKEITYRGMQFTFDAGLSGSVILNSPIGVMNNFNIKDSISPSGIITRLNNFIDRLEDRKQEFEAESDRLKKDISSMEAHANDKFEQEAELEQAKEKHGQVQRALMKSTQMDAVPEGEREDFNKQLETRKAELVNLGYEKAIDEANKDAPRFSRSLLSSKGIPKQKVESFVASIRTNWKNSPEIIIVNDMNDPAIREEVRAENERQLSQGAEGQPEGFFDNGKVYIVASEMNSANDIVRVLFHETLGHYGLRGLYGKGLNNILNQVALLRKKEIIAKARQYGQVKVDKNGKPLIDLDTAKDEDVWANMDNIHKQTSAEEVLAEMAQKNPQLGFVKRAISAIRNWLRANVPALKNLKLTDADIIQGYLIPARNFVIKQGTGKATGNAVLSRGSNNKDLEFAQEALNELAANDEFFRYPVSSKSSLQGIMSDVYKGSEYLGEDTREDEKSESGADKRHVFKNQSGGIFYVYETNKKVWIDVSSFKEGDFGSAVYFAVGNYAHNANKVFVGDPAGLSEAAVVRRTKNMLGLALRFGTTKFIEASPEQIKGDVTKGVEPLKWGNNDVDNVRNLIHTFVTTTENQFPAIKGYEYDFGRRDFTAKDGRPISGERFSEGAKGEVARGARAGSATLRSAILTKSLIQGSARQESTGILQGLLNSSAKYVQQGGLKAVFSRSPQANLAPTWDNLEDSGMMEDAIRALQDQHIDLKRVIKSIENTGANIDDQWNAYLQEELYHGRTAKRTQDFLNDELTPLIEDMSKRGVTMQEFEQYLWARHAEERNNQIATINEDLPDGGSGMLTQDAKNYLDGLSAEQRNNFEALAKRIDAITKQSNQVLLDYGLESTDTIQAWNDAYKYYVPLQREDMDIGFGSGTGQGFSVKGSATRRALGSSKNVVDIIANIAMQREKNIVRGEKNRVATALIGLAKLNPNDDFWQVDTPPTIKAINKATGLVEHFTDPNYKTQDNVVVARIRNRLGKIEERSVTFNKYDERAMNISRAIKNLEIGNTEALIEGIGKVTRYFASVNTQYNPIFGVLNITRDIQGSLLNLSTTPLAGKQTEVLKNTYPALKAIYRSMRSKTKGTQLATNDWTRLFEEFQREGGQTGYRDMFANASDRTKAIEKSLDPTWWTKTKLGKVATVNGLLVVPETMLNDEVIKPVFDWLSDYNETLENAVRLAVYKSGIDAGLSKQQAASIAKNISVNFNRKGNKARSIGMLYAFFNASVQGTARIVETLKGRRGKQIIAGGLLLGAMQALALAAMGFDDDEPPEFVRDRNIIIPIGGKKYLTIPMPLGFNAIPNLGRIFTEWALSGGKDTPKRISHIFGMLADTLNPIGGNGSVANMVAPTVLDPVVDLANNKDFTGKPIAKQDFNSLHPTTGFSRTKDTASSVSKGMAYAINYLTGGDDYKQGVLSPTPDQIDYLIGQVTGGIGRELMKAEQTATSLVTGDDLPTHKIPLVGRFYGDADAPSSQGGKFYDNIIKLNVLEDGVKGRREKGEDYQQFIKDNPEAKLIGQGNLAEKQVSALRKRRKEMVEKGADKTELHKVDEMITARMKRLNDLMSAKGSE
jgi:N12 class adenine-specific DNA methylase/predicted ABC-type ATPase